MATQNLSSNSLNFKLKHTTRGQWLPVDIAFYAYGQNAYMAFGSGPQRVTLYGRGDRLAGKLREAATYFDRNISTTQEIDVNAITPEQVIDFFYNSPNLVGIAPDVEAVLSRAGGASSGDVRAVKASLDVNVLFNASGEAVRGAQSRIAEVLGIVNAGAHRKRVLSVLRVLQREINSTTTQESAEKTDFRQQIAVGA